MRCPRCQNDDTRRDGDYWQCLFCCHEWLADVTCETGKVVFREGDEPGLYHCQFCGYWHRTKRPPSQRYKAKTVAKAPIRGAVERVWEL